jgi:hypothetical protein
VPPYVSKHDKPPVLAKNTRVAINAAAQRAQSASRLILDKFGLTLAVLCKAARPSHNLPATKVLVDRFQTVRPNAQLRVVGQND